MKLNIKSPLVVLCLFFTIITLFSCSKDSDLMADYIALDPEVLIGTYVKSDNYQISISPNPEDDTFEITVNSGSGGTENSGSVGTTVNDTYQTSSSASIVLDVLANDTFKNKEEVVISENSQPENGDVVINSDNTLTYTPFTVEAMVETFIYTVEFVKEDGTVGKETGTVTVTINEGSNKMGELKAFPAAYGAGSNVSGGRGGKVLHVTNLNTSGAGSFKAALETAGPAYIVFDVSGVINLPVNGYALNGIKDKTVLGQTAPRGGITLTGGKFKFNDPSNLIIRFIRSRPRLDKNGNLSSDDDAHTSAFLFYGADGVILDHVSASFAQDKGINFYKNDGVAPKTRNITVSNSLIADSNTMMNLGHNPQADMTNCQNFSVIYNLFGNSTHRTPNMQALGYAEIINNVVHGWGARLSNVYNGLLLNHIGNYYKNPGLSVVDNKHQQVDVPLLPVIYTSDNFYTNRLTGMDDEDNKILWSYFQNKTQLNSSFFTSTMHPRTIPNPSPILTAQEAYDKIIADVGANKYLDDSGIVQTFIDEYDQSVINNVINNIRVEPLNTANWNLPNNLPSNNRPSAFDTDNDGMADAWELRQFGNLSKESIGNDLSPGYTNIEVFSYQVDFE